jgi:NAD+ kinase
MKALGVIANCGKEHAAEALKQLSTAAGKLGLELYADEPTARLLDGAEVLAADDMFGRVDAVMALGGDGTMLRAVRELGGRDKPLIGVNIGSLGFLTSVALEDLDKALGCLAAADYVVSERAVAECLVHVEGKEAGCHRALNDIVMRSASVRVITLDVSVDGDAVNSYVCDGLVVSTPTGSTGHSLSAGGPILSPETPALVVSPICSHALSSRPLVVPDHNRISIAVAESAGEVLLSSDGQVGQVMGQGDRVDIWRSDRSVRFIHLPGHSYYAVLRQKLRWRGSNL